MIDGYEKYGVSYMNCGAKACYTDHRLKLVIQSHSVVEFERYEMFGGQGIRQPDRL